MRELLRDREHADSGATQLHLHDPRVRGVARKARGVVNDDDRHRAAWPKRVTEQLVEDGAMSVGARRAGLDVVVVDDGVVVRGELLHLYAVPTEERTLPGIERLRDYLKGRDRLVAAALERAGIEHRVAPYVFETCAGDSWRLHRDVSAREKQMFAQKRLKGSILKRKLPIEFHADWNHSDDVTWLVRPPWVSRYREPADGRAEPATELLGQTECSAMDYFGNEAAAQPRERPSVGVDGAGDDCEADVVLREELGDP
jgi:hypothetical protein